MNCHNAIAGSTESRRQVNDMFQADAKTSICAATAGPLHTAAARLHALSGPQAAEGSLAEASRD